VPNADCQELGEYHGTVKWYSPEALRSHHTRILPAARNVTNADQRFVLIQNSRPFTKLVCVSDDLPQQYDKAA
jgi:hypothetical protein